MKVGNPEFSDVTTYSAEMQNSAMTIPRAAPDGVEALTQRFHLYAQPSDHWSQASFPLSYSPCLARPRRGLARPRAAISRVTCRISCALTPQEIRQRQVIQEFSLHDRVGEIRAILENDRSFCNHLVAILALF